MIKPEYREYVNFVKGLSSGRVGLKVEDDVYDTEIVIVDP